MARVSVYLPDDLAEQARRAGLNLSNITQEALRQRLAGQRTTEWLAQIRQEQPAGVDHESVLAALDAEREDSGDTSPMGV